MNEFISLLMIKEYTIEYNDNGKQRIVAECRNVKARKNEQAKHLLDDPK